MPDFAPNFTPRYVVEYVSAGLVHNVQLRGARSSVFTTFETEAAATLTALQTALHLLLPSDFAWIGAKGCPADGTFFSPVGLPAAGTAGVIDPADMSHMNRACELNFVGRAQSTPWALAIFGYYLLLDDPAGPASNGRVEPGESAAVTAAIAVLNANTGLAANNNIRPILQPYANYKVNDHWLRIARKTSI
jgi:hypothetical protein